MRKNALRAFATTACALAGSLGVASAAQAFAWGPVGTPVGTFTSTDSLYCGGAANTVGVAYYAPGYYSGGSCTSSGSAPSPTLAVGAGYLPSSEPGWSSPGVILSTGAPLPQFG